MKFRIDEEMNFGPHKSLTIYPQLCEVQGINKNEDGKYDLSIYVDVYDSVIDEEMQKLMTLVINHDMFKRGFIFDD